MYDPSEVVDTVKAFTRGAVTGCDGGILSLLGLFESSIVPAAVSTPKLPSQEPNTLINRIPNQSLRERELLLMLSKFSPACALPLVALPPCVLFSTLASPLLACTLMLLVMALFV